MKQIYCGNYYVETLLYNTRAPKAMAPTRPGKAVGITIMALFVLVLLAEAFEELALPAVEVPEELEELEELDVEVESSVQLAKKSSMIGVALKGACKAE